MSVQDLMNQSAFVFQGSLDKLGASAALGFTATPETAIVEITKILKGPPALSRFAGKQITVLMQGPVTLKAGDKAVFFTNGLHFGDGLAVREVGNIVDALETVEAQVTRAIQTTSDTQLAVRLAQAETVISGVASAPVSFAGGAKAAKVPTSEHDPDWWQSTIEIATVEKGGVTAKAIVVLFANSSDIVWYQSPKIKKGDDRIWLLQNRDIFGKTVPGPTVVHPLDVQPITELERIRTLLKPKRR